MSADLKIEEYRTLLESMHSLCNEMPEVILSNYFDVNKYLYSLYFEAFNSIKGICILLGNGGLITQTASILRMAIEQTATIRVLEDHKELQDSYKEHRRLRHEVMDLNSTASVVFRSRFQSLSQPSNRLWRKPQFSFRRKMALRLPPNSTS